MAKLKKIRCPNCGHKTAGTINMFGRLCMKCGEEILPDKDVKIPLIDDNQEKDARLLELLREMLKKER